MHMGVFLGWEMGIVNKKGRERVERVEGETRKIERIIQAFIHNTNRKRRSKHRKITKKKEEERRLVLIFLLFLFVSFG